MVFFSTFFIFCFFLIIKIKFCFYFLNKNTTKTVYNFKGLNTNETFRPNNGEPFFSEDEIAACTYDVSIIHAEVDSAIIKHSIQNGFGMSFRVDDLQNTPDHSLPVTPEEALRIIEEQTSIKGLTPEQADVLINKAHLSDNTKPSSTAQTFDLFKDFRSKMYCTSNTVNTLKQYFPRPFTASPNSNTAAGLP